MNPFANIYGGAQTGRYTPAPSGVCPTCKGAGMIERRSPDGGRRSTKLPGHDETKGSLLTYRTGRRSNKPRRGNQAVWLPTCTVCNGTGARERRGHVATRRSVFGRRGPWKYSAHPVRRFHGVRRDERTKGRRSTDR